jgi:hypothetical protein
MVRNSKRRRLYVENYGRVPVRSAAAVTFRVHLHLQKHKNYKLARSRS